jgi:8-oxo-dGTP pyrophosphatase MutT (NUDIX family)
VSAPRHPSGEEWNPGEVTEARQAASLILLRESGDGAEVLLVQRNPEQRFMGGAWVFPGGATQSSDADHAATALRELEEEAGVSLPGDTELVPFSRWITPQEVKVRFDTWFFAAEAPDGIEPRPDGNECVDARWLTPAVALAQHAQDELALVFPTIKHLERLSETGSVEDTLAAARARPVEPVMPKVALREGTAHVLLPGDAGYDDA